MRYPLPANSIHQLFGVYTYRAATNVQYSAFSVVWRSHVIPTLHTRSMRATATAGEPYDQTCRHGASWNRCSKTGHWSFARVVTVVCLRRYCTHTCQRPTVVLFVPHRLALGIAERPLSPLVFVTLGAVRALGSRDDGDNAGTPNRVLVPMAWTKTGAASEKCTDSYDRECVEPGALLPTTRGRTMETHTSHGPMAVRPLVWVSHFYSCPFYILQVKRGNNNSLCPTDLCSLIRIYIHGT
jgi:hypothetical protein